MCIKNGLGFKGKKQLVLFATSCVDFGVHNIVDTKSRFCGQVVIAPAPSVEGGLLAVSDNMFVHNNSKVKYYKSL
jgi:hypothetical protein